MAEDDTTKSKPREISKWDLPAKKDLFGREPFVDAIVKSIEDAKEGFNFGISARWGEGKSSILEQLKPKLEKLNYKVLKFQPWKYTQDTLSIKRKFLIDIYGQLGKNFNKAELYSQTERENDLEEDEYDAIFAKRVLIFAKYLVLLLVIFGTGLIFIKYDLGIDINITQTFFTNLFIPFLLAFIPAIQKITEIRVKQVVPPIESAEQFESKFNEVVDEIMGGDKPPKKIIIFVDDLDRCDHTEVEQVLTALFTFFNNPHCTYIITADHTVIRRYISDFLDLAPEIDASGKEDIIKTNENKQREATEYLKKIFQINFILPKATRDVLEPWVKDLIDETPIIQFTHPYAKEYLINLALNNFDSNPRKIKHFLRTLAFQLDAVKEKIGVLSKKNNGEADNLKKVEESPELLAKILIIQDRFPDFYEKLPLEPKLLQRYESGEQAPDKELQALIAQEPKFFNSITRLTKDSTIDPYYFLYFSGSTGFTETRTIDPTEIKTLAKSGDIQNLSKILLGLTDIPRNKCIEDIKAELDSAPTTPPGNPVEKVNIIRSLLHAISTLEDPQLRLDKIRGIINSRPKYSTELAGLQSIDFEKIFPYIDVAIAKSFLEEDPFKTPIERTQIFNAFIAQQNSVSKEVAQLFEKSIAEKLLGLDQEFSESIEFIKKLSPERFKEAETIQDNLLECLKKKPNATRETILEILFIQFKEGVERKRLDEAKNTIIALAQDGVIADKVFILSLIPKKINKTNFDLGKLSDTYVREVKKMTVADLTQIVDAITNTAIKDEIGDQKYEEFLGAVIDELNSGDEPKQRYVLSKISEIIKSSKDTAKIVGRLIEKASKDIPLDEEIINEIWKTKDAWINIDATKKKFITKIKSLKTKNKEGDTTTLDQILLELEPPKKEDDTNK